MQMFPLAADMQLPLDIALPDSSQNKKRALLSISLYIFFRSLVSVAVITLFVVWRLMLFFVAVAFCSAVVAAILILSGQHVTVIMQKRQSATQLRFTFLN